MSYIYSNDDSTNRKLCRIAYGLAVGGYDIDDFLDSYKEYYFGNLENSYFRSRYSTLYKNIGTDAFSVLSKRFNGKDNFDRFSSLIRKYYNSYCEMIRKSSNQVKHTR